MLQVTSFFSSLAGHFTLRRRVIWSPNFNHWGRRARLLALTTWVYLAASVSIQAEDEVFLVTLKSDQVIDVSNISQRLGYDNQPHFSPDSKSLLFTSMFTEQSVDGKQTSQTDSMRLDLATGSLVNLSQSTASEYSPTVTPDKNHFSVIRVGDDGRQLLWQYPLEQVSAAKALNRKVSLLPEVYDVGYHVWLNQAELLLFILGQPMTLERVDIKDGTRQIVDTNIGRTLRKLPNQPLFSYTKAIGENWQVNIYHPENQESISSVTLPNNNMYYAWHNDGDVLSAKQAKIMKAEPKSTANWTLWHDFSAHCLGDITRLVMSNNSQYLAFVCNTADKG
ncbi:TolB family protein [Thalassotalea aquiviva]|uniref:TolB family protein n=1 Tax=Thalassotalea aquiviva TaxID=3242415 RepID=UPI00352A950E